MATQRDAEYNQMFLNTPGPSTPQSARRGTQVAESHERPSPGQSRQHVEVRVTVLRAVNVPSIKKYRFLTRKLFVVVSNRGTTAKTADVPVEGQMAEWNQNLNVFHMQLSSHLTLRLYAKRSAHDDIIIGTHRMRIPLASQSDIPCILGDTAQSTQPVTLYITVNVTPPTLYSSPASIPTEYGGSPAGEVGLRPDPFAFPSRSRHPGSPGPPADVRALAQPGHALPPLAIVGDRSPGWDSPRAAPKRGTQPSRKHPLPLSRHQPEAGSNKPQSREEVSPAGTKDLRLALDQAERAMERMDRSNTWQGAVWRIKWVMDTLSPIAEVFPLAKMAHGLLLAIPQTLLEQYRNDDNVQTLLRAIQYAFDFTDHEDTLLIKSIKPQSKQARILTQMLQDVGTCCDFIQSYARDRKFWKRTLKNIGDGPEDKINELSDVLVKRRIAFLDLATISTQISVFQILDDVAKISTQLSDVELDAIIREIPRAVNSRFSPGKGCLVGTRVAFLDYIANWVNDPNPDSERGLVLFGQAGTGKSSIAHEIARLFDEMHRLTSSFIFSRSEQSERRAYHLFTTLAHHLADRYPSFKTALGKVVKDNIDLRGGTRDYRTLFESLILEPLKDLHIVGPILVVIDALDESGDTTSPIGLHAFIAKNLIRLPSNFRVVITSRPEHAIERVFVKAQSVRTIYMDDTKLAADTRGDILTFFQQRLTSNEFGHYVEPLTAKAEGLFQWAAVANQLILDPPARFDYSGETCIKHLLERGTDRHGQGLLDELYKDVLEGYFDEEDARDLFRSVVGQLITSIEPLTIRSLITLRQHASYHKRSDTAVTGLLHRLGSLLSNVNSSDANLPIIPLHTSFRDFLTNKDKSGDFYAGARDAHYDLAHSCLNLLLDPVYGLKFNICKLETSYLANDDVEDLKTRVDQHIPPALLYACRFWDDHLKHTGYKTDLFRKVETLFKEKFLFWLETLSLTRNMGLAQSASAIVNIWLASSQDDSRKVLEEFRSFVNDAVVFVRHFGMAMAKSAPHIYLSALPFAPTCSPVSTHYSTSFSRTLHVKRGQLSHWPSLETVISNFDEPVLSIAFSPDGQHIVSGSSDRTIRVWNAMTGETTAGPFIGHTDDVGSVAFSPDGQHVVSGSEDGTIRLWNAMTGETVAGPFTGHTSSVKSVAFSPDGQHVVSGSEDRTIRVWYAMTGETAGSPFNGHTDSVKSVAFSPDGQHIVSGSRDGTIRVWDAMTGETAAGPFIEHTGEVASVAFSPDGQHVVSGSMDRTIRVWDAMTGETAASPFTGHTLRVVSVAFSPDGQHIVSGSGDGTIRVWDAMTGETAAGPFAGHTDWVSSVAFSPDGQHIASCSGDRTIRMWNAIMGETVAGSFAGHTDWVSSVAFSPDGQHIVSGSVDQTIRVWDAITGETVAGPFTGHTDPLLSVAFSPDGQHIVSGSLDRTIRVWDAMTGETAAGPFIGHTGCVGFVAFSPDGQHIVSGSWDGTTRVWNATTGETVAGPFTGHTGDVWSVAFSPDGQHIVSGSGDQTIRVWDAITGETVAGPFTEHTDNVMSVAFSPDGQHVVLGSYDGTIRVLNATTGETAGGPFTGHTGPVRSVAFSTDGQHIVSGSGDRTIRVWNAMTGETVAGPFTGHTAPVLSVAFSPDGQHVVSGSRDMTIRVSKAGIGKTEPADAFDLTEHFVINDEGWICGSKGELLMWIPSAHREYLHRRSTIWISGNRETTLNLSNFVHGPSWATCINT